MGDELLFQQLAEQNVATLAEHGVRRIVAHCPHCVNSLRNDYPQARRPVRSRPPQPTAGRAGRRRAGCQRRADARRRERRIDHLSRPVLPRARRRRWSTRRAPCWRPRAAAATAHCRSSSCRATAQNTSCCGGGGGRMWFDDAPAQRVGQGRVREIAATGADDGRRLVPVLPDHARRRPRRQNARRCECATSPNCWPKRCWARELASAPIGCQLDSPSVTRSQTRGRTAPASRAPVPAPAA